MLTLSSDFGPVYSAQVKAVLARLAPAANVVELTHDLPPHQVAEAAFLLAHMAAGFPPGSIHLAVVDPGVGTERAPIVLQCNDGSLLVGPDNGILAPLADRLGGARGFRIERTRVPGPEVASATFDGRDLFAPAAAALARGAAPESLGDPFVYLPYTLPGATRSGGDVRGAVLHVDRFGNLITNLPPEAIAGRSRAAVQVGRRAARRLPVVRTYADLEIGQLGVLVSSFGTLEVSGREVSAAQRLGARAGTSVRLGRAGSPPKYSRR